MKNAMILVGAGLGAFGIYLLLKKKKSACGCQKSTILVASKPKQEIVPDTMLQNFDASFRSTIYGRDKPAEPTAITIDELDTQTALEVTN